MNSVLLINVIGFAFMLSMGLVKTEDLVITQGSYTCDYGYSIGTVNGLTGCRVGSNKVANGGDYYSCKPESCTTRNSKADNTQSSFANNFYMVGCKLKLDDGSFDAVGGTSGRRIEQIFPYETRKLGLSKNQKENWLVIQLALAAGQAGQLTTRRNEYVCPATGDNQNTGIVSCTECGYRGAFSED
ncbi:secreted protein [Melampsora americana]|nr:secreted protein [Melampsora americana]